MRAPAFWWTNERDGAAALLSPLAAIYGAVAAARLARPGKRAALPVICVGDPTVGGSGKTPAAIAVATLVRELGERPAFLTRGYGGSERGPLLVDPAVHDADEVGDEALMLARIAPTVVAADRVAGAALAARTTANVIVMDDGFQNPALAKDLSLLVIDAAAGLGNGRVFPAGPLRAPWPAQMSRAHALVVVGGDQQGAEPLPVFPAEIMPGAAAAAALKGQRVLAFAGIARPEKFFATLKLIGAEVAATRVFADHHPYSPEEAGALLAEAAALGLALVTTEKDHARIADDPSLTELVQTAKVLPVKLVFSDARAVKKMLAEAIARRQRGVRAG